MNILNDPQTGRRRWLKASADRAGGTSGADAVIDHPQPMGQLIEVDNLPLLLAPDPGGVAPRAGVHEFLVEPIQTGMQHSPITNWNPGTPYPGPPARIPDRYVDLDSIKWWGKTGQGKLIWSENSEYAGELVPSIPQDMFQHIDQFQKYWGGYPSLARNRPTAYGDQVPVMNPLAGPSFVLPEG